MFHFPEVNSCGIADDAHPAQHHHSHQKGTGVLDLCRQPAGCASVSVLPLPSIGQYLKQPCELARVAFRRFQYIPKHSLYSAGDKFEIQNN